MRVGCLHENRQYDLFDDYEFTKETARLLVPSWCLNCENEKDCDAKDVVLYYKRSGFESKPNVDWEYNTLSLDDFRNLDYQDSNYDYCDDLNSDLEVEFEAEHDRVPYEIVKLTITYERCSEEEYNKLREDKNE